MPIFKSPSTAGRPRVGQNSPPNIRGQISGPIPIDDEFPIRNPGSALALEGPPRTVETIAERGSAVPSANTPSEVTREDKTASVANSGPNQPSNTPSPPQRRTTRSSTLRYSTVSDTTDVNQPHRKKSTLKSALGKLFGRGKKKNPRQQSISEVQINAPGNHHRSDPSALNRELNIKESESKRSASLPVTEFSRALRSHSVGPDDIFAIHSARNSLQVDLDFSRRRAATTSSRVFGAQVRDFGGELIGLSPRPASTHGLDHPVLGEEDPDDIGRAVTSDSFTNRRRSRSLSQLPDILGNQPLVRNRSAEIKYWRESYDPGLLSPGLSNPNDDETGMVHVETPTGSPVELKPKSPPQPFNFGPMANMKITQAASLEDRIGTLEVRNEKLEKLISQLFQVVSGVNTYPETPGREPPPPPAPRVSSSSYTATSSAAVGPSLYQTASHDFEPTYRYSVSRQSNESFGDGHTFIGSIAQTRPIPRPTSNVTVRGATSLPLLPRESSGTFSADHYTTLKALLDTERAARQALESQVTRLSHKVNVMARTSHKVDTDPASASYTNVSTFEYDNDDEEEPLSASVSVGSEAFKTPGEEGPNHGFGAFGEELRDQEELVDGSRKKAARTLSLSQLTLGKPKQSHQPGAGVNL
ncbi:Uu.00g039310.m01.CDS01 [Anthostomella pinea]|uniref:Uu.00g039310.m01.CDS01 n=1 Tax=Anthostomella pinea TaxID=933095 RepID=A0AAI8YDY9_9PEZI|nr:Uu.00g039310.m01.CDS01 [Anthostomella pinea]